jgi:hypothetical protein
MEDKWYVLKQELMQQGSDYAANTNEQAQLISKVLGSVVKRMEVLERG